MLVLRSALFNVLFYLNLLGLMTFGLPTLLFGRRAVMRLAALWGRSSLALLRLVCGIEIEVRGRENLRSGATIVAAKHQSVWEVFVLPAILPDFTYVLKRELARVPLFGLYVTRAEQIAIDRGRGRAALAQICQAAERVFADGRQFIIFPEGTRRPPAAPPQYKFGVSFIYGETATRCVPVALNSGLFWPRRSFLRRPGTVVIEFLEPIEPGLERTQFLRLLEQRIETASDRLFHEAVARDPTLVAAGNIAPQTDRPAQNSIGKPGRPD